VFGHVGKCPGNGTAGLRRGFGSPGARLEIRNGDEPKQSANTASDRVALWKLRTSNGMARQRCLQVEAPTVRAGPI
jgi:hypothetical protein